MEPNSDSWGIREGQALWPAIREERGMEQHLDQMHIRQVNVTVEAEDRVEELIRKFHLVPWGDLDHTFRLCS